MRQVLQNEIAVRRSSGTSARPSWPHGVALTVAAVAVVLVAGARPALAARPLTVCASGCAYTAIDAALVAAQDGDTIRVAAGTYPGGFSIDKSITLSGAGAGQTIIQGISGKAGISVPSFAVITISGVTITGSDMAGIDNVSGAVTLKDSAVSQNMIQGSGAGIRNFAVMTILNSTVSDNQSLIGLTVTQGGGIMNQGTLTLQNSTVTGNSSGGSGGGIYNRGSSSLTVVNSAVSGNTAMANDGGIANGGVLTIHSSVVANNGAGNLAGGIGNTGTLTLHNSTVAGNSALVWGGGIFNNGKATLQGSTITGNTVNGSDNPDQGGGGIFNFGMLAVKGSTISHNVATSSYGGGIASYFNSSESSLRIADSIITGNSALQGGGVYNTNPNVLVTNSTFIGNTPDDCVNCQP